jgi:hypothetical protein
MKTLPEIPSEFIEPYLSNFMNYLIEGIGTGLLTVEECKNDLRGVEHFISIYGGVHSRIAMSNQLGVFLRLSDSEMETMCKKIVTKLA